MSAPTQLSWEEAVRRLIADRAAVDLVRDNYFDPPLERAAARYHQGAEWCAVQDLIGGNAGAALDVGAGNGIVSYALAKDGWAVTALEPDPSNLVGAAAVRNLAATTGLSIQVVESFAEQVALPSANFDLIVARQVMHHAHDLKAFTREMARVLKPGGHLLSFRDHVADDAAQKAQFFDEHPLHRLYGGENAYSEGEYRDALVGAGLIISQSWGHFAVAFNYAPLTPNQITTMAAAKLAPRPLIKLLVRALSNPVIYPAIGRILSRLYRHPGRHVAFFARKPI